MPITTLDGVKSGKYIITTEHGTRHVLDLDKRTDTRYGAHGHVWDEAGVGLGDVTPDGNPMQYILLAGATVGEYMVIENRDEWRQTSEVKSIEVFDAHEDDEELPGDGADGSAELDVPS